MSRAARFLGLVFGGALLLCGGAARAQLLPQGLTCGLSYTTDYVIIGALVIADNACNSIPTVRVVNGNLSRQAAPGFGYVFDGDLGASAGHGYHHQELLSGIGAAELNANPHLSENLVLPRGTVCGLQHSVNSRGKTCMGRDTSTGCPLGWTSRYARDDDSVWNGNTPRDMWEWCSYDDPHNLSLGSPALPVTGIACGLVHNGEISESYTNCMAYRPRDGGGRPLCPPGTVAAGWYDLGVIEGVGLGFCTLSASTPPPAPARGVLETTVSTNGTFSGWAFDPFFNTTSLVAFLAQPIYVDLYVDGPAGSGAPGFRVLANQQRPDVATALSVPSPNVGFVFTLPAQFLGAPHKVYAYAISLTGTGNPLLSQSPGTYTPPPVSPPPDPPNCSKCLDR